VDATQIFHRIYAAGKGGGADLRGTFPHSKDVYKVAIANKQRGMK